MNYNFGEQQKKIYQTNPITSYAVFLHKESGKNNTDTMFILDPKNKELLREQTCVEN